MKHLSSIKVKIPPLRCFFLWLDCSTQSVHSTAIDFYQKKIVYREYVNFEKVLPHYKAKDGVIALKN